MANNNDYKYLFCIGAQKSGTSYLYQLIKQHKAVTFSGYKEIHHFSEDMAYKRGTGVFLKYFKPHEETEYLADFTPEYMHKHEVVRRISEEFGEQARIIVIMRDPVKRAFSNYIMAYSRGRERRLFSDIVNDVILGSGTNHIIERGLYAKHLDNVYKYFSHDRVLLLVFEDFIKNTAENMEKVIEFLGIEKCEINYDVKKNPMKNEAFTGFGLFYFKIPYRIRRFINKKIPLLGRVLRHFANSGRQSFKEKPVLNEHDERILSEYYKKSNERVRNDFGVDISEWL